MKSLPALATGLLWLVLCAASAQAPRTASASAGGALRPRPSLAVHDPQNVLHGGSFGLAKSAADSFNLYGGVRADGSHDKRPEGQFNTLNWFPQLQGWTSVDLTEVPPHWHVSTFNATTLDGAVNPNHAMFCGVEAGTAGYISPPGYGNNWNDQLDWYGQANPAVNTSTRLVFDFHHDSEPDYDFFSVQFDSAGTMVTLLSYDASNKNGSGQFVTPVHFDRTVLFRPNMYVGSGVKYVHLRLRFAADGAASDEDGLWPTSGAVQLDNIQVRFNGALVTQHGDGTASFEPTGADQYDTDGWDAVASDFVGDFGKLFPQINDIDPCRTNLTPQIGFIDDGTPPKNAPTESTGGTTSPNWSYGILGGWVVNYNGGLTLGLQALDNEFWSPEILWNDPSTTGDDPIVGGAFARWDVWQHLPLLNGMFWVWHVRSFPDASNGWGPWQDRNFVYYGGGVALYGNVQVDVSDLLVNAPQKVQMALGTVDLADIFGFPGNDATPSPTFDNASFWKYRADGPAFAAREIDLFNDGFATGGAFNYKRGPALMSVRMDMALDINIGTPNTPGDSIVVDVVPVVPGTTLAGPGAGNRPVMRWILDANPAFNTVRSIPAGAVPGGTSARGFATWRGTVVGDSARTAGGAVVADRYFFDLPNDGPRLATYQANEPAMFFPGDIIRYFLEAVDSGAHRTTLPADTAGFLSGKNYNRTFTVRALPNLRASIAAGETTVTQPVIMFVNDFGHRGAEDEWLGAFGQNGLKEGTDFDVYTVQGPSSLVSNGIGSSGAHGANAQQLKGYNCLFYECGNLSNGLISNGSDTNGNDKGNDAGVLTAWATQAADRRAAFFGDNVIAGNTSQGGGSLTFVQNTLGISYSADDVRLELGDQTAPRVKPTGQSPTGGLFSTQFIAYGGCLSINQFDSIRPRAGTGAVRAHEFLTPGGVAGQYAASASVYYAHSDTITGTPYPRVMMTFPYGFLYVQNSMPKAPSGSATRSKLLAEILQAFGRPINNGGAVAAEAIAQRRLIVEQNRPNPFNPATTIRFFAPARGHVAVTVYNLRGEVVARLLDGAVDAGEQAVTWRGVDGRGASVASGIYLYAVEGFGQSEMRKMALIK